MKFHCVSSLLLVASFSRQASAFSTTTPNAHAIIRRRISSSGASRRSFGGSSSLSMSSVNDEVARLKAAAAAARADVARLSKELGKDTEDEKSSSGAKTAVAAAPKKSSKSNEEIAAALTAIDFGADAVTQTTALDRLREEGSVSLYKSVTVQGGSGDLRDYPVSLSMLESRAGLTAKSLGIGVEEVNLDDFKYATLWVVGVCTVTGVGALAFLPENIGATICYLAAIIPILFLGVGSTAPSVIANAIAGIRGSGDDAAVSKLDRVCRHEAAHFLCGYLCGLPISSYSTAKDANVPRVEFHSTRTGPLTAKQELTEEEVNALTVVALSGSVAEAMAFGSARGATSDLIELEGNVFRQSGKFIGAQKQQELTRWGALTAHRLLTQHKQKLDCLVDAFAAQKTVAECVAILEQKS